jgi:hypothetical protein
MLQPPSFEILADHAKSLAEWIRDDEAFCTVLIGTDRVVVASVVDTVAETCTTAAAKSLGPPENTYDHNLCKDVMSVAEHVIATVYTLNHVSDGIRWRTTPEYMQRTIGELLDTARTLRARKDQINEISTEPKPQQAAAPKPQQAAAPKPRNAKTSTARRP